MKKGIELLAFCDASGVFAEHYQSIGVISGITASLSKLRNDMQEILNDLRMSEIKFSNINKLDSREFEAAQRFFTKSINNYIKSHSVRADILTWYTADSRHSTPGRDDIENLGRMYYHLLRNIAGKWNIASWYIYIDKNEQVDFAVLKECLNSKIDQIDTGQFPEIIESLKQLKELEVVKEMNLDLDHEFLLVEIPIDFYTMLRETDVTDDKVRSIPLDWRLRTREAFKTLLGRSYKVIDFCQIEKDTRRRDFYVLKK